MRLPEINVIRESIERQKELAKRRIEGFESIDKLYSLAKGTAL